MAEWIEDTDPLDGGRYTICGIDVDLIIAIHQDIIENRPFEILPRGDRRGQIIRRAADQIPFDAIDVGNYGAIIPGNEYRRAIYPGTRVQFVREDWLLEFRYHRSASAWDRSEDDYSDFYFLGNPDQFVEDMVLVMMARA